MSGQQAKGKWERIFSANPYNTEAAEHIKNLEVNVMKRTDRRMAGEVEDTLDRLGPETGRPMYQKAIRIYE